MAAAAPLAKASFTKSLPLNRGPLRAINKSPGETVRLSIETPVATKGRTAGASIADLLSQARGPFQKVVQETDRVSAIAVADHEYLDKLLDTLPDKYRALGRQGMYGDFFSFYLCDLVLKLNGKGGQPVYVKVAGQDTGRCTPK